jgi:7,8-dihydropterin-6-yl-methyl-4-(beta-D-ribofuranosyl)aminobenzene 5'-phosphate synthase
MMDITTDVHGSVNVTPVERLVITVITDNYYDALRSDAAITRRFRTRPGQWMHAEHGLSFFIEASSDGGTNGFMFDYGLDAQGVHKNMEVLGIDVGKAVGFGLSHGHFDHWTGLTQLLTLNRSKIQKGSPLYVGEDAFERRYSFVPGTSNRLDIGRLSKSEIEALGLVSVVEVKRPTEVMPGGYFSGNLERVTEYEKVPPYLLIQKGETVVVDTFPGEQAMVFHVKDKGLVIVSGCAHAGIINTIKHLKKITGIDKVHAVIGGFHLVNAQPEVIQRTIADLKAINPDWIIPAHCTGFEATKAFSGAMPDRFILNTAGTQYTFGT